MNVIRRAIARELLSSSSSSSSSPTRSSLFLLIRLQPQSLALQKPSCLYSTLAEATTQAPVVTPAAVELPKNTGHVSREEFPRPSEIPWQEKAANWVSLIGRILQPVQVGASPDGKYWAGTILAQGGGDRTNLDTKTIPFWISIIFQGNLAHIAASHLKEADYVHVAGVLSADATPFTVKEGHPDLQVMVHDINFVQSHFKAKTDFTSDNRENLGTFGTSSSGIETKPKGKTASDPWRDLLRSPESWMDYRVGKRNGSLNPKYPDFKHRSNGTALWLDSAPGWFLPGVNALKLDVQLPNSTQSKETKGTETKPGGETASDPWKDLLENPQNWVDHRLRKHNGSLNPKFPDFKHKSQRTALWVDKAPKWVLPELDALKLDDDSWKELVENPDKWWDNRIGKVNPRAPDFRHKERGVGLWLNDCPPSLLSSLPPPNPVEEEERK